MEDGSCAPKMITPKEQPKIQLKNIKEKEFYVEGDNSVLYFVKIFKNKNKIVFESKEVESDINQNSKTYKKELSLNDFEKIDNKFSN